MKTYYKLTNVNYFIPLVVALLLNTTALFANQRNAWGEQSYSEKRNEYLPGVITVKVKEGIGPFDTQKSNVHVEITSLDQLMQKFSVSGLDKRFVHKPILERSNLPALDRIYKIKFPEEMNVLDVVKAFAADPNIEYAEPMYMYHLCDVPDDPMYNQQQFLPQIMAEEAWDVHKGENGTEEVVMAIVDSGTDWLHPDLTENIWQNLGEDADGDGVTLEFNNGVWERDPDDLNGIDDDNNGFVDDVIGWDFADAINGGDGSNPDPYPDMVSHGTHCSGIAAARTNNGVGISSISYNIKYMPLRTNDGYYILYGFDGIIYAAENGADIINLSWGGGDYSQADRDVIDYAVGLGAIVVAAAGNYNEDAFFYPASYPGVISVAAVNADDTRASFSNYGTPVDVSAPGVDILSTIIDNSYESWNGTSMAAPMVAGLFGLLKSYHPDWTNDQLMEQLIGTTDNIDNLNPAYENALGSGRINAYHALVDENVVIPPQLKIGVVSISLDDADGDGVFEAGESVSVSLSLRNFSPYGSDENATVNLVSFDNDVTITTASASADIPMDDYFELSNTFEFTIAENTKPHFANLLIEVTSEVPEVIGGEIELPILVAPSGFLVWDGDANNPDYSGPFIKDFLESRGYDVLYTNAYQQSFDPYDGVFLSFGNMGQWFDSGTFLSYPYTLPIQDYLENGGKLYSEGSPFLSIPENMGYPNANPIEELYGLESVTWANTTNEIDELDGNEGTLGENMNFFHSNQQSNWYIERFTAMGSALLPFNEKDFGDVAISNQGIHGQKTFHFAYTMSQLVDEDPHSSRYNLMVQIMKFFGYSEGDDKIIANFSVDKTEGNPDLEVQFTDWSIPGINAEITEYAWDFDEDGVIDSYDKNPVWTYSKGGVYNVKLIINSAADSDTMVKKDYITVRSGILVYEGKENENGYSGTFINEYLQNNYYDEVGYTNTLPSSLEGYDAVFLSFGNTGSMGTPLTNSMVSTIVDYNNSGGNIYIEGGDAMSAFDSNGLQAFGLSGVEHGEKNILTDLTGQDDAITTGLHFEASSQWSVRSIDSYEIYRVRGISGAFNEGTYGLVAVQFDGTEWFGQKTFCLSYSLANLEDGDDPNTRNELLSRILEFFSITTEINEQDANSAVNLHLYPNPASTQATLAFDLSRDEILNVEIYNLNGQKVLSEPGKMYPKGQNLVHLETDRLNTGFYICRLISSKKVFNGKLLIVK